MTVVTEILHQDDDGLRWRVAEELFVKGERVLERSRQVIREVLVGLVIVDEVEIGGAARLQLLRGQRRTEKQGEREKPKAHIREPQFYPHKTKPRPGEGPRLMMSVVWISSGRRSFGRSFD